MSADDDSTLPASTGPVALPAETGRTELAHIQRGYNAHLSEQDGTEWHARINWRDWLRVLRKQIWIIAGICIACTATALIGSLLAQPLYTAAVTIQLDRNVVRVIEAGNITPAEAGDRDFFQTQYELLRSRNLAERVVAKLGLASDPTFTGRQSSSVFRTAFGWFGLGKQDRDPVLATGAGEKAAVGVVMANTRVEPVRASRLVTVQYTGPTPELAQNVSNALGESFVSSNLDRRVEANSYAKRFLEDQLQELKLKLEESDRGLVYVALYELFVSVGEKSSLTETNLSTSNAALSAAVGQRIKAEQSWRQAETGSSIGLPQFLESGVIQSLRAKRVDLSSDYKDKLGIFKPDYPDMVRLKSRLDETDRQIASEIVVIKSSLRSAYLAALAQEELIGSQVDALKTESLELQRRSIQYNILKREVDTSRSIYDGLLQRYKEVGIAGGVGANNVSIVDRAERPGGPSSPRIVFNTALGCVLGLGLGIGLALLREYADDTMKSGEDMERVTRLPVLGLIPSNRTGSIEDSLADPRSAVSEAYRSVVTSLQFSSSSGVPRTLLVTSAKPSEGKSTTSLSLARNFAAIGYKVLLIDCDLRKPSMHRALGVDNSEGLTNYLAGGSQISSLFKFQSDFNFYFLPSGPLPPNPAELLSGPRLSSLLSVASDNFDLVILDGPPVMGLSDSPLLGHAAAGTLLVVAAGETRGVALRASIRRLMFTRTTVVGTVMTKFDSRNVGYGYGYGYGYGGTDYYYSYGNDSDVKKISDETTSTPPREAAA